MIYMFLSNNSFVGGYKFVEFALFSLSIFGIFLLIFFKLGIRVDIGKKCLGIADG